MAKTADRQPVRIDTPKQGEPTPNVDTMDAMDSYVATTNEEDNILKQAMAAINEREQAQPLHHNSPINSEPQVRPTTVIEDAYTRPLYKEYTRHSDTARARMELAIAEAVQRGEILQARIAELQAEYLDILVEVGMYKKSLEYKEMQ